MARNIISINTDELGISHELVGPKILENIKIYILTRPELHIIFVMRYPVHDFSNEISTNVISTNMIFTNAIFLFTGILKATRLFTATKLTKRMKIL